MTEERAFVATRRTRLSFARYRGSIVLEGHCSHGSSASPTLPWATILQPYGPFCGRHVEVWVRREILGEEDCDGRL